VVRRGLVAARDLRPGDELPAADAGWKLVTSARLYRPADGVKVYDVFLDSPRAPMDRLLNMDGLLAPSYEWQKELGTFPSITLFDASEPMELW
jgi:hypothetical protein